MKLNPFSKEPEPVVKKTRVHLSPQMKAKSAKAKVDALISKTYYRYLKDHPTFAEQIAREQFGFKEQPEETDVPMTFLDKVKELKTAMTLIKDEFGGESKQPGILGLFNSIVEQDKEGHLAVALAGAIEKITGGGMQKQLIRVESGGPPTEQLERERNEQKRLSASQEKTPIQVAQERQQHLSGFIHDLSSKDPKQMALDIYNNRSVEKSIGCYVYQYVTQYSFDDLVAMLQMLSKSPGYEFINKQLSGLDIKQLALVYDEIKLLDKKAKTPIKTHKSGEVEVKSP